MKAIIVMAREQNENGHNNLYHEMQRELWVIRESDTRQASSGRIYQIGEMDPREGIEDQRCVEIVTLCNLRDSHETCRGTRQAPFTRYGKSVLKMSLVSIFDKL